MEMDKLVAVIEENIGDTRLLPDGVGTRAYLDALYWVLSVIEGME